MSQTQLSFWLNADVKEQFEAVCNRNGMTSAEIFEPDDHLFTVKRTLPKCGGKLERIKNCCEHHLAL